MDTCTKTWNNYMRSHCNTWTSETARRRQRNVCVSVFGVTEGVMVNWGTGCGSWGKADGLSVEWGEVPLAALWIVGRQEGCLLHLLDDGRGGSCGYTLCWNTQVTDKGEQSARASTWVWVRTWGHAIENGPSQSRAGQRCQKLASVMGHRLCHLIWKMAVM